MSKMGAASSWIIIALAMVFLLSVAGMLLWPYRLYDVSKPAVVLNKTVHVGDQLCISLDQQKYTDKCATLTKQYINDTVYTTPGTTSCMPKGAIKTTYRTEIPHLPPGEYYLRFIIEVKMNPLRTITITFDTDKFRVAE